MTSPIVYSANIPYLRGWPASDMDRPRNGIGYRASVYQFVSRPARVGSYQKILLI